MCGTIGTARQASAGGHARHAATAGRAAPAGGTARQPAGAVPVPPLADPQGNDVTGRWPLRSFLELGALPSAVPCARLHTRQLLWEWGLTSLIDSAELIVSEIMTNAVQVTQAETRAAAHEVGRGGVVDRVGTKAEVTAGALPAVRAIPSAATLLSNREAAV